MRPVRLAPVVTVAAALALSVGVVALGCGTEAVGIETCRQIEEARCLRGRECGIDLANPLHRDDDVAACVRFYKEECLHGLASKNDPGGPKVKACVDAISGGACTVVVAPESDPACDFLIPAPVAPPPDAGSDASDAATDVDTTIDAPAG